MTTLTENRPVVVMGFSTTGGFLLLFCLLYVLSFVQREEEPVLDIQPLDIRSVEVPSQDEDSNELLAITSSPKVVSPNLPTQPKTIPSRTIEPLALSLQVDVSRVLEERNTLDYLMTRRDLFGAFGSLRLEGVDSIPKTLYLPPNIFPRSLKEQGIYSGKVLLLIEISEQGVGKVRQVVRADYPELVDPVVESIHGALYSRPKRRGKPTRTIIKSLIHFRSTPEGDNMLEEVQGQ